MRIQNVRKRHIFMHCTVRMMEELHRKFFAAFDADNIMTMCHNTAGQLTSRKCTLGPPPDHRALTWHALYYS